MAHLEFVVDLLKKSLHSPNVGSRADDKTEGSKKRTEFLETIERWGCSLRYFPSKLDRDFDPAKTVAMVLNCLRCSTRSVALFLIRIRMYAYRVRKIQKWWRSCIARFIAERTQVLDGWKKTEEKARRIAQKKLYRHCRDQQRSRDIRGEVDSYVKMHTTEEMKRQTVWSLYDEQKLAFRRKFHSWFGSVARKRQEWLRHQRMLAKRPYDDLLRSRMDKTKSELDQMALYQPKFVFNPTVSTLLTRLFPNEPQIDENNDDGRSLSPSPSPSGRSMSPAHRSPGLRSAAVRSPPPPSFSDPSITAMATSGFDPNLSCSSSSSSASSSSSSSCSTLVSASPGSSASVSTSACSSSSSPTVSSAAAPSGGAVGRLFLLSSSSTSSTSPQRLRRQQQQQREGSPPRASALQASEATEDHQQQQQQHRGNTASGGVSVGIGGLRRCATYSHLRTPAAAAASSPATSTTAAPSPSSSASVSKTTTTTSSPSNTQPVGSGVGMSSRSPSPVRLRRAIATSSSNGPYPTTAIGDAASAATVLEASSSPPRPPPPPPPPPPRGGHLPRNYSEATGLRLKSTELGVVASNNSQSLQLQAAGKGTAAIALLRGAGGGRPNVNLKPSNWTSDPSTTTSTAAED